MNVISTHKEQTLKQEITFIGAPLRDASAAFLNSTTAAKPASKSQAYLSNKKFQKKRENLHNFLFSPTCSKLLLRSKARDRRQTLRCLQLQFHEAAKKKRQHKNVRKKSKPWQTAWHHLLKLSDRPKQNNLSTQTKQNKTFQRRLVFVGPGRAVRVSVSVVIAEQKIAFCSLVVRNLSKTKVNQTKLSLFLGI